MKTITVTDEQYDFLINLSELMQAQDNRITEHPIFCVYQKEKVIKPETHASEWCWADSDGELAEEDVEEKIKEFKEDNPESTLEDEEDILEELGYSKFYYEINDVPVQGQSYFSENAAKRHIELNDYHYSQPFTFVESAWRNYEWQTIREIILSLTKRKE